MSYESPDWHTRHVPMWRRVLAPLIDAQRERAIHVLEIGAWEGRSSCWIARELLHHEDARLFCVDPFDDAGRLARFEQNIAETGRAERVRLWRGLSCDVLPAHWLSYRGAIDFVYVDGSHEAPDVLLDSVLALEFLKPGGVLIWDDYEWHGGSGVHAPRLAIDAVLAVHAERLRVLHRGVQVAAEKLA